MMLWGRDKKETPKPAGHPSPGPASAAPTAQIARPAAPSTPVVSQNRPQAPVPPPATSVGKTLEDVLLETGAISQEQLTYALEYQQSNGGFLVQILIDLKFLNEDSYTSHLAKYCKIPHLSLLDYLIDKNLVSLFPKELCMQYRLLPIDKLGKNLTVAMVNPLDNDAIYQMRKLCPDLRIKPILCAPDLFAKVAAGLFVDEQTEVEEVSMSSFGLSELSVASKPSPTAPVTTLAAEKTAFAAPTPLNVDHSNPFETMDGKPFDLSKPISADDIPDSPALNAVSGLMESVILSTAAPGSPTESAHLSGTMFNTPATEEDMLISEFFQESSSADVQPADSMINLSSSTVQGLASSMMQEMVSVMRDSMRDTYAMLTRRIEIFRGLAPEEVAQLFTKNATTEYEQGVMVFEKGDWGKELYIILGGQVNIYDGERLLAELHRGDMFGEMSLVSNEPRSASAIVMETTSLLVLNEDVFTRILSKDATIKILMNMLITLSQRLRKANQH